MVGAGADADAGAGVVCIFFLFFHSEYYIALPARAVPTIWQALDVV